MARGRDTSGGRGRLHPDPVVLAAGAGLIGLWWLASALVGLPVILPAPPEVFLTVLTELRSPGFVEAVLVTLGRGGLTLLVSVVCAVPLGMLAARRPVWERLLRPLMTSLRSVPFISVILLAMVWFQSGTVPLFVALLMVLPLVYESARSGVAGIDPQLFRLFDVHRIEGLQRVMHLLLPGARGALNGGLKAANGIAWKVTVAAEVLSNPSAGIGVQMGEARLFLETERLLAWTVVLIVLSGLGERLISLLTTVRLLPVRRSLPPAASFSRLGPGMDVDAVASATVDTPEAPDTPETDGPTPRASRPATLAVRNLRFSWPRTPGGPDLFIDFSLELAPGEVVALLGPSGVGKSTLLSILAGEVAVDGGTVSQTWDRPPGLEGEATTHRCALAFQRPALLPWRSAAEHVSILDADPVAAERLRELLGLPADIWGSTPAELSGGMAQRLALLVAVARPAGMLLLDEPLSAIDEQQRRRVSAPLRRAIAGSHRPVIVVLHDARSALELADRVLVLGSRPVRTVLEAQRSPQTGAWDDESQLQAAIAAALE